MTQKSTSTRLLSSNVTGSVQRSAGSGGSGEAISCGLNCFRRIFALFILVAFISIIVFSLNRYVVVAVVGNLMSGFDRFFTILVHSLNPLANSLKID